MIEEVEKKESQDRKTLVDWNLQKLVKDYVRLSFLDVLSDVL